MTRKSIPTVPIQRVPQQKKPAKPKPEADMKAGKVSSIGQIFSIAWSMYKKRGLTVLAVSVLTTLISGVLLAAIAGGGFFAMGMDVQQMQQFAVRQLPELLNNPPMLLDRPALLGLVLVLLLSGVLLVIWQTVSTIAAAVDEYRGVVESLCTGWRQLFSAFWALSLYSSIVAAGSMLIVPGVIWALSMSFVFFVMLDEERSGIDALLASRLYMRGRWWNTLFKAIAIMLASMALSKVPVVGWVLQMLVFPSFSTIYFAAVYRDLKQAAGRIDPEESCRCLWMFLAFFGMLLPLMAVVGSVVAMGPKLPDRMQKFQESFLEGVKRKMGIDLPLPKKNDAMPADAGDATEPRPSPLVRELNSVDGFVVWRDPDGDASNPLLDIREVAAVGEKGELTLSVTLTRPFSAYFAAVEKGSFDRLISFYVDTDMNSATGAVPFGGEGRSGYDLNLEILLASQPNDPPGVGRAHASMYRLDAQTRQSMEPLDEKSVAISGQNLHVHLPYGRLAAAGRTVRVCFQETSQQGGGLAKDQLVPLQ